MPRSNAYYLLSRSSYLYLPDEWRYLSMWRFNMRTRTRAIYATVPIALQSACLRHISTQLKAPSNCAHFQQGKINTKLRTEPGVSAVYDYFPGLFHGCTFMVARGLVIKRKSTRVYRVKHARRAFCSILYVSFAESADRKNYLT